MAPPRFVLADDLSGACECAGALVAAGVSSVVDLGDSVSSSADTIVVRDLDLRNESDRVARARFEEALGSNPSPWFVKVDSLLRGPICAIVDSLVAYGSRVIICTALPAMGRTVIDGRTRVHDIPLQETDHWTLEHRAAPSSIGDVIPDADVVTLETLRGPRNVLADRLRTAGDVISVDAEWDSDLDRLVDACKGLSCVLVGSGAFFEALVRTTEVPLESPPVRMRVTGRHRVLAVVGTASRVAMEQCGALVASGSRELVLDPTDVGSWRKIGAVLKRQLESESAVVRIDRQKRPPTLPSRDLSRALGNLVTRAVVDDVGIGLVLVGGETAREVLAQLGVRQLRPRVSVQHGALLCHSPDGRSIGIRPGSFGGENSLADLAAAVEQSHQEEEHQ